MTGRENIFMNGAILGMSRADIQRKLDDIIDFSGCARYIDTPVKRYSSGMTVRLGFAVAAFLEPEILVVDEVLAVGDAEFQKKAIGKMQDVSKGEGRTVLFVSHNMASVRQLCHTGILLENGSIAMMGKMSDVIDTYVSQSSTDKELIGAVWNKNKLEDKPIQLIHAEVQNANGDPKTSFSCDEDFYVELTYKVDEKVPGMTCLFSLLKSYDDSFVLQTESNDTGFNYVESMSQGINRFRLHFPKRLIGHGTYFARATLLSNYNFSGRVIEKMDRIIKFDISDYRTQRGNYRNGYFSTIIDWDLA